MQRNKLDIVPLYTMAKISDFRQRYDDMPIAVGWHVVYQVNDPIFQTTCIKAVHHMGDKRSGITFHCSPSNMSIDGRLALAREGIPKCSLLPL